MASVATGKATGSASSHVSHSPSTAGRRRDEAMKAWKKYVQRWYPRLHHQAYFVPPVYMNRINYKTETVCADTVALAQPPVKATPKGTGLINVGDVMEDQAQQHILHCLRKLFQQNGQVVFVLSQLNFTGYLGEACFAAAAREFPRPMDLKEKNQDRGDFDFLFIHRQYGLVACEVKSIGTMFGGETVDKPREDKALVKRLQQVARQLNKSRDVLEYLTGDLPQPPRVTTSLMLPYITAARLGRVLTDNPRERQALCDCLGIPYHQDPVQLCVTSDRLSDKDRVWHVTDDVTQALTQWWQSLAEERGEDVSMDDQLYEDLLARFAGPATTMEVYCPSALPRARKVVRSEGEAVSETAERCMDLVLSPQQIQILNSREKLVHLTGPPGTGKTVVLLLKAGQWLTEGHDVHVVSTSADRVTASYYLYGALQQKYSSAQRGKVHFLRRYRDDLADDLTDARLNDNVYITADEIDGQVIQNMRKLLLSQAKDLHMWTANIFNNEAPSDSTTHILKTSLRSPTCVTREVQVSINDLDQVEPYEENPYPHTDGPSLRELRHQGPGHDDDVKPDDCETCGQQLATALRELHVGEPDAATSQEDGPRTLQFRDVFVLALDEYFKDSSTGRTGEVVAASGFVRGLRQAGVPVRVFKRGDHNDPQAARELGTGTGPDAVVACDSRYVAGLERKVVVWVQTEKEGALSEAWGRLNGYSRCSGQLITISWPHGRSKTKAEDTDQPECAQKGAEGASAAAEGPWDENLRQKLAQAIKDIATEEEEDTDKQERREKGADGASAAVEVHGDKNLRQNLVQAIKDIVTEEKAREIDCVFQLAVSLSDGADVNTFVVNMKEDRIRVTRGVWPGEEKELAFILTISPELAVRALVEGEKVVGDLVAHKDFHLRLILWPEGFRVATLFKQLQPRIKAALWRILKQVTGDLTDSGPRLLTTTA